MAQARTVTTVDCPAPITSLTRLSTSSEDSSDGEEYVTELQRSQQQRQLERRQRPAELVANPAALPVRVLHGDSVREITGGARRARRVPLGDRLRRQQSDGPVQHVAGFRNHDVRPGW